MNRLPRVETTRDKEKRLAFKEQLAAKLLDAPEAVEPVEPVTPTFNTLNGVPLGGILYHRDFGAGTLKTVSRNEVIVEFSHNTISFVPSVAQSFLSPIAPSSSGRDRFEEPFIDPIVRPNPVVNVASREVPRRELLAPAKPTEKLSSKFEGRTVWHPDFGACPVVSVDVARNEIVLKTNSGENVSLILRAMESKLAILPEDTNLVSGKKLSKTMV